MAWIELHQSLTTHKKTRRLTRKLGLVYPDQLPQTIGHLCMFWLWCVDGTKDGRITDLDAQDIADAAGWTGDPEVFYTAMRDSGFIEETDTDIIIHDWHDYIGRLLEKREELRTKERERKREYRNRLKEQQQENSDYRTELEPEEIDQGWLKVVQAYEKDIGMVPMGSAGDDLQSYYDTLGADVVCKAIEITNKAQASNPWKYLDKVLRKWLDNGINTLEKAEAYNKDLERRIEASKARRQETTTEPPAVTKTFY